MGTLKNCFRCNEGAQKPTRRIVHEPFTSERKMINGSNYLLQETKMDDIRSLIWQGEMHLDKASAISVMCDRTTTK